MSLGNIVEAIDREIASLRQTRAVLTGGSHKAIPAKTPPNFCHLALRPLRGNFVRSRLVSYPSTD